MMELYVRYDDGKFELPPSLEPSRLKDARVKVVVTVAKGPHESLSHEAQNELREKILAGNPSELKLKIEHQPESRIDIAPVALAKTAEQKLRAYWEMKGAPPTDRQDGCWASSAKSRPPSLPSRPAGRSKRNIRNEDVARWRESC